MSYDIVHGNIDDVFAINRTTGWIKTAKTLDGNDVRQYILTIQAADGEILS